MGLITQNVCMFISFDRFLSADNTFFVVTGGKCPFVRGNPHKTERGLFCHVAVFFSLIESIRERSTLRDGMPRQF